MRALRTFALGALLLGCQGKDPDTCVSSTAQPPFINGPRFLAVGERADLEVVLPAPKVCTSGLPAATGVEVEVADAEGNPVAHTVGAVSANVSRGYAVRVAFTVASVGQHFVRVRFEPSLGVVQTFVEGAADFSSQAWVPAPAGWDNCLSVVALGEGALGCRRGGGLDLWRDGGAAERLEGDVREGGGDGLWSLLGSTLRRFERRDGGLALTSSVEVDPSGGPRLYDARGDAVLLGPRLTRVSAGDGALTLQRIDDDKGQQALIFDSGGAAFADDGGLRVASGGGVCDVAVAPAPSAARVSCTNLFPLGPASALSTSEAGLWLSHQSATEELVLLARSGGRFSLEGASLLPAFADAQVPRLRGAAQEFLPVLRGGRLALEAWRAPPGATIRSADDRVVFAVGAGQAFLSRRPSP